MATAGVSSKFTQKYSQNLCIHSSLTGMFYFLRNFKKCKELHSFWLCISGVISHLEWWPCSLFPGSFDPTPFSSWCPHYIHLSVSHNYLQVWLRMGHHWVPLWTATEKKSFYQTQNTNQNVHFQIYKHQQHITKIYWGLFCNINQLNIARKEQACAIYMCMFVHVLTIIRYR